MHTTSNDPPFDLKNPEDQEQTDGFIGNYKFQSDHQLKMLTNTQILFLNVDTK